jgi:hypothetical protein
MAFERLIGSIGSKRHGIVVERQQPVIHAHCDGLQA